MLVKNGSQKLREFTEKSFQEKYTEVVPGVWFIESVGHSNSVFIETGSGVILIDTLDSLERGQILKKIITEKTGKKVKTIIYTHGHPDHRGGAGAFAKDNPEIIAFTPKTPALEKTELLQDIQNIRGNRQFGYVLTDEENISQGIGRREGIAYQENRAFLPPNTVYKEDCVEREIDGIRLEIVRVPGEAEEAVMIWLPQKKVLCCGDTYYGCFPNLYAIRGSQYRDIAVWIKSIDLVRSYPADYLLPGHTGMIAGEDKIKEVLGNFRNAFEYILTETLKGMNQGKSAGELAAEIVLPPEYAELPYLGEYYGCVEWTVRAVYAAYLGWFDGNPAHLHPLAPKKRGEKMTALLGGKDAVLREIQKALEEGENQWCMELCDLLLDQGDQEKEVRGLKAKALRKQAEYETSANGRHYYLVCARELEE